MWRWECVGLVCIKNNCYNLHSHAPPRTGTDVGGSTTERHKFSFTLEIDHSDTCTLGRGKVSSDPRFSNPEGRQLKLITTTGQPTAKTATTKKTTNFKKNNENNENNNNNNNNNNDNNDND